MAGLIEPPKDIEMVLKLLQLMLKIGTEKGLKKQFSL